MHLATIRAIGVTATGLAFWAIATFLLGTKEPWDSPLYPAVYLASLGLCGAFGYMLPSRSWCWGLIVIFSQLPVMMLQAGRVGPMIGVGLGLLALQAMPATLVAVAASHLRISKRPG